MEESPRTGTDEKRPDEKLAASQKACKSRRERACRLACDNMHARYGEEGREEMNARAHTRGVPQRHALRLDAVRE